MKQNCEFCKRIYVKKGLERQFPKYHSICPPSASMIVEDA